MLIEELISAGRQLYERGLQTPGVAAMSVPATSRSSGLPGPAATSLV